MDARSNHSLSIVNSSACQHVSFVWSWAMHVYAKSTTRNVTAAAAVNKTHLDLGFDLIWLRCFSRSFATASGADSCHCSQNNCPHACQQPCWRPAISCTKNESSQCYWAAVQGHVLSCMYLGHHELDSISWGLQTVIITIIVMITIIIVRLLCLSLLLWLYSIIFVVIAVVLI